MRKVHTILLALGLIFLVFLIQRIGIHQLWRQLTMLGWGLVPLILAEGIAEFFHAISWRYCLIGSHRNISLVRLFRIHLAAYAINFFTPTASVGGDATKTALLAEHHRGPEALAAVLIGKLSFALGHLLFVILGAVFVLSELQWPPALWTALVVGVIFMTVGILIFLILQEEGRLAALPRWLVAHNVCAKTLQRFVRPMECVDAILKHFYRERPWNLVWSVFWHLLGYSVGIFAIWYFLLLVEGQASLAAAARVWFLAMWMDLMTFAVPLNLGVLEGGRLVAFRMAGFGVLPGMSFGLVTRVAQLFWAGAGLANYALMIKKTRVAPASDDTKIQVAHRFTNERTLP
jgi:uncharacterized membrane protein YbhN (UPF0104 family)